MSAANDGVPSDQAFAMGGLLSYLVRESNVATQTDTNHNNKNMRGQVVGGARRCIIIGLRVDFFPARTYEEYESGEVHRSITADEIVRVEGIILSY